MESWKTLLLWTVIGAVLSPMFGMAIAKGHRFIFKSVNIETHEERGPTTRKEGFTESSVKVSVKNNTGHQLSIVDVRLMFSGSHGFPVLPEAPSLRKHPALPATLNTGESIAWHFPAEKMARFLTDVSLPPAEQKPLVKLRPRVTVATGKVYKGRKCNSQETLMLIGFKYTLRWTPSVGQDQATVRPPLLQSLPPRDTAVVQLRQDPLRRLLHLAGVSERMCQAELSHGAPEVVNHSSFAFRVHRFLQVARVSLGWP